MTESWKQWEGQVLNGEFYLRQYLGGSENSAVFLTEHGEREPQKAAIKLLVAPPEESELQLFRWELAAKLSHPHLIRLFQMGRCQLGNLGLLYVVMEYAEENLSQILSHQPLTPADTREMLEPVLDALAYVHGQGFAHGHIKPANIMGVEGQLKISTDGLFRMGESRVVLGKPSAYDAPEMAGGWISAAADVWSLGMTLVEGLTQRLPVWREPDHGEPVLPETLPAQFLELARHCLQRDLQRRWTVADIVAHIRQTLPVLQGQTAASPQAAPAKWRYVAPAVTLGLVLAAMLVVLRLFNDHREAPQTPSGTQTGVQSQPAVTPKSGKSSAQRTDDKKQGSPHAAPERTPVQSEAGPPTTVGLVPGKVVHQVLPDVPRKARDTIRGTVRVGVRVRVDPSGHVAGAKLDSPGPSRYFARLALKAARRWKFRPAEVDARNVPSEWILRFEFGKDGTKVLPVHATP
jgi:TonB family protein